MAEQGIVFGHSGLDKEVADYIRFTLPMGGNILELGSGKVSTQYLGRYYKMTSVEHDKRYVGQFDSNYIHAPLVDHWYDPKILKDQLPKEYDLLLVDGPVESGGRLKMLGYLNLFDWTVPWVFHDTDRPYELKLMETAAKRMHRHCIKFPEYPFFGVII